MTQAPAQQSSASDQRNTVLFVLCVSAAFGISWLFHNHFWWGPDDGGYYGYIANRLLSGDVLHRDIQTLHPGLIHFTNATFLSLAGGDLVSLRYPLVALTMVQAAIAYVLARSFGWLAAVAAAATLTSFSFLQFINPTPHWYTLCLAIVIIYVLSTATQTSTKQLIIIGFLVGVACLFRQLTGVFLAIAVTTVIFLKASPKTPGPRGFTGSIILGICALGLSGYIISAANIAGLVLIGIFPPLLLGIAAIKTKLDAKTAFNIVFALTLGAVIATLPLIFYHIYNGSLIDWFRDVFITPFALFKMPFYESFSYFHVPLLAIKEVFTGDLMAVAGLLYWQALLLAPAALGLTTVVHLYSSGDDIPVAAIIACFYSLVSIHIEIPIYLTYSSGIVLLALLLSKAFEHSRNFVAVVLIALSINAVFFHAAQSLDRGLVGIATNQRGIAPTRFLPGTSILVNESEAVRYAKLISTIDTCARKTDTLYAFPMSAELNFLSKRKSPFRFFTTAIELRSEQDVKRSAKIVENSETLAVIIHKKQDKYNTAFADRLLQLSLPYYNYVGELDGYDIYQRKNHPFQSSCRAVVKGSVT